MDKRIFVDVNVIQNVPPSCLNRDDTGSPKTAVYGGVRRARVSSQSWKRAMREQFHDCFDESEMGVRTIKIVELIADKIMSIDGDIDEKTAVSKAVAVIESAGVKLGAKAKDKKSSDAEATPQAAALFFMSRKQVENMATLAVSGEYTKKDVLQALNKGYGVDIALFGRMVADNPSLNADASSQVAHSISTHRVDNEYDYYTAVDDMISDDTAGAAMIGTVEYNSSTLYRYATLAVHDLSKQLEDPAVTSKAVREFVRAFVLSMPTGKQNTFANRTLPYAVFVAVRKDQPVNLVSAFENPVQQGKESGGFNSESVRKMVEYEKSICSDFVEEPVITWQIGKGLEELGPETGLQAALNELSEYILGEL